LGVYARRIEVAPSAHVNRIQEKASEGAEENERNPVDEARSSTINRRHERDTFWII